jgi:hypothetical protein
MDVLEFRLGTVFEGMKVESLADCAKPPSRQGWPKIFRGRCYFASHAVAVSVRKKASMPRQRLRSISGPTR